MIIGFAALMCKKNTQLTNVATMAGIYYYLQLYKEKIQQYETSKYFCGIFRRKFGEAQFGIQKIPATRTTDCRYFILKVKGESYRSLLFYQPVSRRIREYDRRLEALRFLEIHHRV